MSPPSIFDDYDASFLGVLPLFDRGWTLADSLIGTLVWVMGFFWIYAISDRDSAAPRPIDAVDIVFLLSLPPLVVLLRRHRPLSCCGWLGRLLERAAMLAALCMLTPEWRAELRCACVVLLAVRALLSRVFSPHVERLEALHEAAREAAYVRELGGFEMVVKARGDVQIL